MSLRFFDGAQHAVLYAQFRPRPPPLLAERIVQYLKEKFEGNLSLCLDVGCGSGQCSDLFSPYFTKVLATDISEAQIDTAKTLSHPPNVHFQISPAEECPVESESVQLVNACVAAHWFDLPAFFKETDRILSRNGIVALTDYDARPLFAHGEISDQLYQALNVVYDDRLGSYWPDAVFEHTANEYCNIILPYQNSIKVDVWTDEVNTLAGLNGYIASWSAFQKYCRANGVSAGQEILAEFTSSVQKIMGTDHQEPEKIELTLKRKYVILMGRKT